MESKLQRVEELKRHVGTAQREALRLANEPGGGPDWPSEAVAEADEIRDLLFETQQRVTRLYALTPSQHALAAVDRDLFGARR